MDTSLTDRFVRTRIPNNAKTGGQMASTSFNIRENKRNFEWLLKQSSNAFKLVQIRYSMFQYG